MTPLLLNLPLELLDMIIHHAVISRGLSRALRLKLVCKTFAYSVDRTLFHTKLLDSIEPLRRWEFHRHHCAADKLWHDYLVFRCRDKRDESAACYVGIRETADALVRHIHARQDDCDDSVHVPASWDQVLDKLCWLAMGRDYQSGNCMLYYHSGMPSAWWGEQREWWGCRGWRQRQYYGPDPRGSSSSTESIDTGLMMLSAATYLGYTALVRELLNQGHDPAKCEDDFFPKPMYIAAWTGRADILPLLQEHHPPDLEDCQHLDDWRSNVGPGSLHGAAAGRGDLDMVLLCLYPPSLRTVGEDAEETDKLILGQYKPGSIPQNSKLGTYIERAMQRTRSPKVYDYLLSLLDKGADNPNPAATDNSHIIDLITRHLAVMSGAGDITMVHHILRLGADPSTNKDSSSLKPLVQAISSARNHAIINLLLSRGADPNGREKFSTPLLAAVKTGSLKMVRRILDAGARVQFLDDEERALRYAVQMEHMAMVELLLDERGVVSTDIVKACCLWRAERMGLESMAELLRSKGARLTPWGVGVTGGVGVAIQAPPQGVPGGGHIVVGVQVLPLEHGPLFPTVQIVETCGGGVGVAMHCPPQGMLGVETMTAKSFDGKNKYNIDVCSSALKIQGGKEVVACTKAAQVKENVGRGGECEFTLIWIVMINGQFG
ncbi:ankyrin repeat-containing domain protein [Apodospora peruviana]|uniref:Ankyrin repeat-containing domain protein n=1 Tax=Apodospora peruviana TaxID=516989 RepID=A0AAE0M5H3_9PEZI|nr:ankyrin repeat-containing domain protein [Apodospora peruviana]